MTDNVKAIRGGAITSSFKQQMLDHIAQRYDELAAMGDVPVCVVFSVVADNGGAITGFITDDCISDRNSLHLARGIKCLSDDYGTKWLERDHTCGKTDS